MPRLPPADDILRTARLYQRPVLCSGCGPDLCIRVLWVQRGQGDDRVYIGRDQPIAADIGIGAIEGLGDLALQGARFMLLNELPLGGYDPLEIGTSYGAAGGVGTLKARGAAAGRATSAHPVYTLWSRQER